MARIIALILLAIVAVNGRTAGVPRFSPFRSGGQIIPAGLRYLFGLGEEPEKRAVCETDECKLISKIMTASMDKSVDPCDDFYSYACGKWPENNMFPDSEYPYSLWAYVYRDVKNRTEDILTRELQPDDPLPVKLAKRFYDTCMNVSEIDKSGLEPFVTTLSRIGGWPLIMELDEWSEEDYPWQKVDDYYARLVGSNAFFKVYVSAVNDDQSVIVPILIMPRLALAAEKLEANEDDADENSEKEPGDSPMPESSEEEGEGDGEGDEGEKGTSDEEDGSQGYTDEPTDSSSREDSEESEESQENRKAHKKHLVKRETRHKKHRIHNRRKFSGKNHVKRSKSHGLKKQTKKDVEDENPCKEKKPSSEEIMREKYADFIAEVALSISNAQGDIISRKSIEKGIQELVDFCYELQALTNGRRSRRSINTTIGEMQEWYDDHHLESPNSIISWHSKLSNLMAEANVDLKHDQPIKVAIYPYIEDLISLLNKTPMRTIVNYVHWAFVSNLLMASNKQMRQLYYKWEDVKEDDSEETLAEREEMCKASIEVDTLLAYDYVKKYMSQEVKESAADMVEHIKKAVEVEVSRSKWLDDWAKTFVREKLENMKKVIGFPDWYNNETAISRYYNGLVIGPSFFENLLSYERYKVWDMFKYIRDPNLDFGMMVDPLMLNAFYVPNYNGIAVTAVDLQSPLFAASRPATINYGIIGVVLGHEVNHGFDGTGRNYDKRGKITEWLSTMADEYSKRAECFVEQYESYADRLEPNGTFAGYGNLTMDENIADTMGLEACYNALKMLEEEKQNLEATIPGFEDFTRDQLFFLSYANLWCESERVEGLPANAMGDEHSTGPLRVRGAVSNMKAFADAFNCPAGSPMNPEKKCNIWN